MKCSNPNCTQTSPVFYESNKTRCKVCVRTKQRAYRTTPEGMNSHYKYRSSTKGKLAHVEVQKKYRDVGKHDKNRRKWLKYNTVTRDTLTEMPINDLCTNCNENTSGFGNADCSVAYGSEDLKLCPVYQEFKNYDVHPIVRFEEHYYE